MPFTRALTGTDDIQWMPPGQHTIHPSNDKGEVVERTVLVDEAAAEAVEELRRNLQEGAADGLMDEPFIDYDHQDHDAAGWSSASTGAETTPRRRHSREN